MEDIDFQRAALELVTAYLGYDPRWPSVSLLIGGEGLYQLPKGCYFNIDQRFASYNSETGLVQVTQKQWDEYWSKRDLPILEASGSASVRFQELWKTTQAKVAKRLAVVSANGYEVRSQQAEGAMVTYRLKAVEDEMSELKPFRVRLGIIS